MVGLAGPAGPADVTAIQALGGTVHAAYAHLSLLAAELPAPALARLARNPRVRYVEPDQVRYAIAQTLPWGIDHIDADIAWSSARGAGVKLAILDTGGDYDHPDLSYVGGVNFAGWLRDGSTAPAQWDDKNGHGTWTSGIAAALDNDIGVVGAAPDASLWAVKVLSNSGTGWDSDIAQGIDWAIGSGMDVISMSLGGPGYSTALAEACQDAWEAGMIIVAAAGNEGDGDPSTEELSYPAAYPTVIAVGATTQTDGLASFSNTGSFLELGAPGVSVYSTYKGGGYASYSGTSASCPHVSGVVALVLSADPGLTNGQVRALLADTARDLGAAGWDAGFGYGLVDAGAAVAAAVSAPEYDAAVTGISAPSSATVGDIVNVTVDVANNGLHEETIEVAVTESPEGEAVGSQSVSLPAGGSTTVNFSWDTGGNTVGDHTLVATAFLVGDERSSNDSRGAETTLTEYVPPPTGLDITVSTNKGVYTRGEWVYITVLATDGGSPSVPQPGVYALVEVATAAGAIYISDGYTGTNGTVVYQFKPKPKDGYGTYLVAALGDNGLYTDADNTAFEVMK
jgi:subtilisin